MVKVCYAYLSDVSKHPSLSQGSPEFTNSRWFTRGWTLQELLALYKLVFSSKDWDNLGDKHVFCRVIEEITGIDVQNLRSGDLESVSVAKKMSRQRRGLLQG
jgi:hypothetical protein